MRRASNKYFLDLCLDKDLSSMSNQFGPKSKKGFFPIEYGNHFQCLTKNCIVIASYICESWN